MRNKFEDLSPNCTKIVNTSADFYLSLSVKISKNKLKKFVPYINGLSSDESLKNLNKEPLSIKGVEFSSLPRKKFKQPISLLPKLEENSAFKTSINCLTEKSKKKNSSKGKNLLKKEKLSEKPLFKQIFLMKSKIITKVGYKEAARLQEWAMIAKPELEKIWRNLICASNGVKVSQDTGHFKYFVGKGNNSALVRKLLAGRNWWTATESIEEANFIWTQWKDKSFIQTLPKGNCIQNTVDISLIPCITYQVPVRINNTYRQVDLTDLGLYRIRSSNSYTAINTNSNSISNKLYNKLEFNQHLSNKKGLFRCLKNYYETNGKKVFDHHPVTFHIINGEEDPEFSKFLEIFNKYEKLKKRKKCKNFWIIKPAENSNRGNGIQVVKTLSEIKLIIKEKTDPKTGQIRTYILQKYIEKPLLVHNRKFDIRCYSLVTCINGVLQCYFYTDGYIRTSCVEYNLYQTSNNFIHLTNDAVQKHSEDYGKYEDNNKMSYKDLQRYFDFQFPEKNVNFFASILPKIRSIVKDTVLASFYKLDFNKRLNCMELLGYDFMLDSKFKPWIIEVNTNPCLELSSSYLSYLIPTMLDNVFRITIDTLFPSPNYNRTHEVIPENRFDLIFHELVEGNNGCKLSSPPDDIILSDTEDIYSDNEKT